MSSSASSSAPSYALPIIPRVSDLMQARTIFRKKIEDEEEASRKRMLEENDKANIEKTQVAFQQLLTCKENFVPLELLYDCNNEDLILQQILDAGYTFTSELPRFSYTGFNTYRIYLP